MPIPQPHRRGVRGAAHTLRLFAIVATLLVVAVIVLLVIWAHLHPKKNLIVEPPPVDVAVLPVTPIPQMVDTVTLPAVVEAFQVVNVAAEVASHVDEILAHEGDTVSTDFIILRLDTELLKAEYDRASAQAKYDKADFDRLAELARGGAATGRDREAAEVKMEVSQAIADEAKTRLERAIIRAPIGGVLNRLPVEVGEYVNPGTIVAQIIELDKVKVVVEAPEKDVQFLTVGEKAVVSATVKGEERDFHGVITYISQLADPGTRTSRLEITVTNPDRQLRSGEIVRAQLSRRILHDVIMVPLLAVIPLEDGKAVFLVEGGKAQSRRVELGLFKGSDVQITSGLTPGDQLIVKGQRLIGPGQAVRVVPVSETAQ